MTTGQMPDAKPEPWTEHGRPVTRTFAKVTVADAPDPRTGAVAGNTTIGLGPQGWEDPMLVKLLGLGGAVTRAWVVVWRGGYPVREPNDMHVCRHCWRPVFRDPGPGDSHLGEEWNLVYREYAQPRWCDARSDGANLDTIGHEPWSAE